MCVRRCFISRNCSKIWIFHDLADCPCLSISLSLSLSLSVYLSIVLECVLLWKYQEFPFIMMMRSVWLRRFLLLSEICCGLERTGIDIQLRMDTTNNSITPTKSMLALVVFVLKKVSFKHSRSLDLHLPVPELERRWDLRDGWRVWVNRARAAGHTAAWCSGISVVFQSFTRSTTLIVVVCEIKNVLIVIAASSLHGKNILGTGL